MKNRIIAAMLRRVMTTNTECLTEMVRKYGQKLIDEADKFVGDDIEIKSIKISFEATVNEDLPIISVTREYSGHDCYVPIEKVVVESCEEE